MENFEIYQNLANEDMVAVFHENGSVSSMPKATYDEQQAKDVDLP
jgi:hypothetical protein